MPLFKFFKTTNNVLEQQKTEKSLKIKDKYAGTLAANSACMVTINFDGSSNETSCFEYSEIPLVFVSMITTNTDFKLKHIINGITKKSFSIELENTSTQDVDYIIQYMVIPV